MNRYNLFIIAFMVFADPCYAVDSLRVDEKQALFSAIDKTVPVITSSYVGWAKNWRYADTQIHPTYQVDQNGDFRSTFIGKVPVLGIDFTGVLHLGSHPKQMIWNYSWDKQQNVPDATGFGIEFKFALHSPSFSAAAKSPELLPGNTGWRWQTPEGYIVTVQFVPALSRLFFEGKQGDTVRAFFFESIVQGENQTTMTVTVDETVKLSGPGNLLDDAIDLGSWHQDVLPLDTSPVDLSFLNEHDSPAGKHGVVKTNGDRLMFADGTPVKFWGANVQAAALFTTSDENIKKQARRIAQLGFNLVRVHHHDAKWVKPNIFKNPEDSTQALSAESFRKLDLWISCLQEQGVYIWLDLHVGRTFTKNDGIDNFSDLAKGKEESEVKGFNYYSGSIQSQMQVFNAAYLSHVNEFTGIAYKDDPSIVALLLTNENDLSHHFGSALLGNKGVPLHSQFFYADAKIFAATQNLSYDKIVRTWEMGASKIYLNDVEHRFNRNMLNHLQQLGVQSLIATTNSWGGMGLSGLPSLTDGGIIDVHAYGSTEEFSRNPRFNPGFLSWAGAAKVSGKPLSMTEWNIEPFPAADRFTAPLFVASIASLQGWDAIMLYGYSQASLNGKIGGSNYSSFNDPAIMGLMPAASLLYRQDHVALAKNTFALSLDRNTFFNTRQDPTTSKTIRTLLETSRFAVRLPNIPELPWLKSHTAPVSENTGIKDSNVDFIPAGQSFVQSDTGELLRNWEKGIQTINTAKSQVAAGELGGEDIKLSNATLAIRTKKAVVAIQSLDSKPIENSNRIFVTLMARSLPDKGNKAVFLSEPVTGEVTFTASPGLQLYPVSKTGELGEPRPAGYADGRYSLTFDAASTHWYVMQ
jgi:hypothetical protein